MTNAACRYWLTVCYAFCLLNSLLSSAHEAPGGAEKAPFTQEG
jgi:hypothetical protein